MFPLICTRIIGGVNNGEAGDLRRYRAHCDVNVMCYSYLNLSGLVCWNVIMHGLLKVHHVYSFYNYEYILFIVYTPVKK